MPRQHLKQRSDGRYACRYKDQWFMGYTEREALEAREKYKLEEKQHTAHDADKITVREYAARWLPVHKASVDSRTYNDYAHQINILIDTIGDLPVSKVTATDIKTVWLHYLGYSDSAIKHAKQLFNGIFDTAVEQGYIRTNPARSKHAQPHKGTEGTHRAITDEERQIILRFQHPFRAAVMAMLYAGLRRGEVLALRSDDVDFDGQIINVFEAVQFRSNQPIIKSTKTKAGIRQIPLFSILRQQLIGIDGYIAKSSPTKVKPLHESPMSESAFTSAWNSYINDVETMLNGHSKRWHHRTNRDKEKNPRLHKRIDDLIEQGRAEEAEALRLADWKTFSIRPHDLRHSFCTMLRDNGVDIKLAMRWMGHADEKMILRIYDHITESRTRQAVGRIEKMLDGRQNGRQKENQSV